MITRRTVLAGAAALPFIRTASAAEDWKAKYPEITFAVIPAENGSGVTERYTPFVNYLSKELGIKVSLRVANDYAAVIEGQRAGNIQIGYYGPASFSRALAHRRQDRCLRDRRQFRRLEGLLFGVLCARQEPLPEARGSEGQELGLVDPNSTSGNNMPRFKMNQMGIDPDTFFSQVVFTGSHENAVLALAQGTVDVCANWWNAENDSNLTRMLAKNMVKSSDGKPLTKDDFRIIVKSDLIINSPYAYLGPAGRHEGRDQEGVPGSRRQGQGSFAKLSDGKNLPWQPVTNADYDKTVELIKFVDTLRKKKSLIGHACRRGPWRPLHDGRPCGRPMDRVGLRCRRS